MKLYDRKPTVDETWIVHHIGYKCNSKCPFCIVEYKRNRPQPSLDSLFKDIDIIPWGVDRIYFTGGEPTIRKDLLELIDYARPRTHEIWLQSNVRKFSKKSYTELVGNKIDGVLASLHVSNRDDSKTVLGSKKAFDEAIIGLENLLYAGVSIETNTVISKYTYKKLDKIVEFIRSCFDGLSKIHLVYASFNPKNPQGHFVRLSNITEPLENLLKRYGSELEIENVPLCIADTRKYNANFSDGWRLVVLVNNCLMPISEQRKYIDICNECSAAMDCQGLYIHYNTQFDPALDLKVIQ